MKKVPLLYYESLRKDSALCFENFILLKPSFNRKELCYHWSKILWNKFNNWYKVLLIRQNKRKAYDYNNFSHFEEK